ncbi:transcriptional regulator [Lactococcus fujiensis JCM 16395]|uniref:Transcriptional regulator n=1 Tax=Lactococcus fujiensis JCM 16395 TaxID=1291764 RepID=A0A2A5RJ62_9LACT|nr:transcriptional regulator [Lactococcus fujiensis JCM 16395]
MSGYSKSTVSRAISGNGYVSEDAKKKILRLANELDYVTNAIAQDLAKGTNHQIGLVLPHVKHPFFKQILEGVLEKSFDTHFKIVILPSNYDEALEIKYLEQFRKKAFEAMIFTSTQVSEERLMTYQKYGPLVLCHKPAHADIPAIYTERRLGYEAAFAWMKMQGVKSIGFLFARAKSPTTSVTISAYEKIFGQKVRKEQMLTGAISDEDGYALAPEVGQFDGIFANSDNIAAGLWLWYEERGLKKPLIVGQEKLLAGQLLNLPTVDNHYMELGQEAFQLAISKEVKQVSIDSNFYPSRPTT